MELGKTNITSKMDRKSKSCICKVCNKKFSSLYTLRRHIKQVHPDNTEYLPCLPTKTKDNYKYSCEECQKYFNDIGKFNFHNRKVHNYPSTNPNENRRKKCPLCDYITTAKVYIIQHFQNVHDFEICTEIIEFVSLEQFDRWKVDLERDTFTAYRLERTGKSKTHQIRNYTCHRSGFFKSKGQQLRRLKRQGTQKINGYCPASIKLTIDRMGMCVAELIRTHVGHENDLEHVHLTRQEKQMIAIKLEANVPLDCILDDIKANIDGDQIKRIHLVKKKDLYNIKQSLCGVQVDNRTDAEMTDPLSNDETTECENISTIERDTGQQNMTEKMKQEINELIDKLTGELEKTKSLAKLSVIKTFLISTLKTLDDDDGNITITSETTKKEV